MLKQNVYTEGAKEMLQHRIGKEILFFDGGMGTLLQSQGLQPGELPEVWNLEHPERIREIHKRYFETGSDIVLTNTFGANAMKFHHESYSLKEIISAAVEHVKEAAKAVKKQDEEYYVALDIGPTGKLLKPMGDLAFEDAYEVFCEVVQYGTACGVDLIHIETMSDTYEVKAAVLAAKEHSSLPIFVTLIFDEKGKLLTGGDVKSVVTLLEGLGVDALGINCGMGPNQMLPIVQELAEYTSLPIIAKPNAGLPKQKNGKTYFDVQPDAFAEAVKALVEEGACIVGGCCGTTPEHLREMINVCKEIDVILPVEKNHTLVSSYGMTVELGEMPIVIGERINPTGKSKFKQALKNHDIDYILREGISQQEKGAHILDVNVGLPDIDENSMMKEVIPELQSITKLPLQIDTVDPKAMETAMRIYNGKAMINSVSGKQESMDAVFPLVKKYGGVVVGLTLDENGIPETAQGRLEIAGKIITEAKRYGIKRKDIVIDVLAMTVSSDPMSARVTLEALKLVRETYGVKTVLGVSNISFGLPNRAVLNAAFYTMAMQNGLSAGIINPLSAKMMEAYDAYCTLQGFDDNFENYIERYGNVKPTEPVLTNMDSLDLNRAIVNGLKDDAKEITKQLLQTQKPMHIIQEILIPALDVVGKGFENKSVFLPQLLMSAEAAKSAFEILKTEMVMSGEQTEQKEKILLATVKGDIHDIGKNIVKVLLENYGFDVIDLGKDVGAEVIVQEVLDKHIRLVGLSALMTTTVINMEETIKMLHHKAPWCKVMVGGAVLNQEYADQIGADFYGKDAMQSVYYAQETFSLDKV